MDLRLDPDDLNTCVQCGLCLPHCPTYRVTGDETMSPRGRIKLMREVQDNDAPLTDEVVEAFATCVQCRGCEPACPSGVPFGHLMERTRESLVDDGELTPRWQRLALKPLGMPRVLAAGMAAAAAAQRLHVLPRRLGLTDRLPFRPPPLQATGDDVYLFTGCVMDAVQRDVHRAAVEVLTATGVGVLPTGDTAPCCGALELHAGLGPEGRDRARQIIGALRPDVPVIVDAAGCGAAMKDYGRLLGTSEAHRFAERVFDIGEFLAERVGDLASVPPLELRVAVQDPCHLRHVQRVHEATRTMLAPFVTELVELDDEGLCCGAGGAYSLVQPELAGRIRDRKLGAIDRAHPDVVASANPGCSLHLAAAGVPVRHPVQLVAQALSARTRFGPGAATGR
ncbi:MAG: (Fe-S)-binding protein [Acidimicrobiales bacterium]